jgi:HTH-type transcriptional regulator, competence development regulator
MAGNRQFGRKIRELREVQKAQDPSFSLRQFAQKIGISATFLSKVENGEVDPPSPENIKKIAELLGINSDELLALAGKVDPEVKGILTGKPEMADFLRTFQNRSPEELKAIMQQYREKKQS